MDPTELQNLIERPTGWALLALAATGFVYLAKEVVAFLREHVLPRLYEERLARSKLSIPFAQKALDAHWREAAHFRDGDPKLVDFQQHRIFIRPEVGQIEVQLRRSRFLHLQGAPSSGKTVIALTFAYNHLVAKERVIYFARPSAIPQLFFDYLQASAAIRTLDSERITLIVDDVHLGVSEAARLFSLIFERYAKLRVIYVSRDLQTEQLLDIDDATQFSFARFMPKVDVSAETAFGPIADFYSMQRHSRPIPPAILSFLRHECGGDLLLLGRYLREWDGASIVNLEKLRGRVWEAVRRDLERLSGTAPDAVQALLVLGLFYRFEVTVEQSFMEDMLGLHLDVLIQRGEIRCDNGFVRVHHSSQAKLYSNAIQSLNMPGYVALSRGLNPFPAALFKLYLQHAPRNACELLAAIRGTTLLNGLLEDTQLDQVLRSSLERERNLDLLGWALVAISRSNKKRGWQIIETAALDRSAPVIMEFATPKQLALFMSNIEQVSHIKARDWLLALPPATVAGSICELGLKHFAGALDRVKRLTNADYFDKVLASINSQVIFDKLIREEDLRDLRTGVARLGRCLGGVFCVRSVADADFVGDWTTKVSFHFGRERVSRFLPGRRLGMPYGTSQRRLFAHWKWLVAHRVPDARIVVDDGAAAAIRKRRSLFPVGVSAVKGRFDSGDVVAVLDQQGKLLGIGVSNYSSPDLDAVKKLRMDAIVNSTHIAPNRVFDNDRLVRHRALREIGSDDVLVVAS